MALPIDFILEYINRPKKLTQKEVEKIGPKLLANATELVRSGEELKKKYAAEMKQRSRDRKTLAEIDKYEESLEILEHVRDPAVLTPA